MFWLWHTLWFKHETLGLDKQRSRHAKQQRWRQTQDNFWLAVWNIFYFPYMGCHPSYWRTHIFQRGRSTTNQIGVFFAQRWGHFGMFARPIYGISRLPRLQISTHIPLRDSRMMDVTFSSIKWQGSTPSIKRFMLWFWGGIALPFYRQFICFHLMQTFWGVKPCHFIENMCVEEICWCFFPDLIVFAVR